MNRNIVSLKARWYFAIGTCAILLALFVIAQTAIPSKPSASSSHFPAWSYWIFIPLEVIWAITWCTGIVIAIRTAWEFLRKVRTSAMSTGVPGGSRIPQSPAAKSPEHDGRLRFLDAVSRRKANRVLETNEVSPSEPTSEVQSLLRNSQLHGRNLKGIDLSDSDLAGSDLSYCNLSGADLSCSILTSVNFEGSDLTNADLSYSILRNANVTGTCSVGADFSNSDLSQADFSESDLTDADLSDSLAWATDLSNCVLLRTDFTGCNRHQARN